MAGPQLSHLMGMADTPMGRVQRATLRPRGGATGFTPYHGSPACQPRSNKLERGQGGEEAGHLPKGSSLRPRLLSRGTGFTLVELTIGASILLLAIVTLLNAFGRQSILNTHSRNLTWAMNDASRVMERLRQQNSGSSCLTPTVAPPAGFASWDAWLGDTTVNGGGGKSIQPAPLTNELIVMSTSGADPLQVTAAVCWRSQERTLGECQWNGAQLVPNDTDGNGIITGPATVATLVTCRR